VAQGFQCLRGSFWLWLGYAVVFRGLKGFYQHSSAKISGKQGLMFSALVLACSSSSMATAALSRTPQQQLSISQVRL
jgi:hypothetical protein